MKKLTQKMSDAYININIGDVVKIKSNLCIFRCTSGFIDFRGIVTVYIFTRIKDSKLIIIDDKELITYKLNGNIAE